jgi:hypothetical protein
MITLNLRILAFILAAVLMDFNGLFFTRYSLAGRVNAPEIRSLAPLYLKPGEQRQIHLGPILRYSMSGSAIRTFRLEKTQQILLKAQRSGISTLWVERQLDNGQPITETRIITVEAPNRKTPSPFPSGLLRAFNSLDQTEVIEAGDRFVLRGQIHDHTTAVQLSQMKNQYGKFLTDETELSPDYLQTSEQKIRDLIKPYSTLELKSVEDQLLVHGSLPHNFEVKSITTKIQSIQPLTVIEIQSIQDRNPTLYFKVYLLEVKKEQLLRWGTEWTTPISGSLQVSPLQNLLPSSIGYTLDALSQDGMVKILSSPELVVRAPGQAELFAGGELPIRQRSRLNESVIWRKLGLNLLLDVQSVGGHQVRLTIETNLTHLDPQLTNDEVPGIRTNHIKTQVDAQFGKPLLLSGLLEEDLHKSSSGIPLLKKIPVLGKLFSSESFQESRSELVAILLPSRQVPQSPLTRISSSLPRGFLPIPRNSISFFELVELKSSSQYPWNAL